MVRPAVLTWIALAAWSGCGGTLVPPDGGQSGNGGGGGGMSPPLTGAGGGATLDAGSGGISGDAMNCWERVPAAPIPDTECLYSIPVPPCDYLSPNRFNVYVDDAAIPQDTTHAEGWDYTDETFTAIEIHGAICAALVDGTASAVTIYFYPLL